MRICKTIVDVRSTAEYEDGHVDKSVNIPLDEVIARMEEIQKMPTPILVCCGSGQRATVVVDYLKEHDIDSWNGGGWEDVQNSLVNKEICLKQ